MTAAYLLPMPGPIRSVDTRYMAPVFKQRWWVFAPDPVSSNVYFSVRATKNDGTQTPWFAITRCDSDSVIHHHPMPNRRYLSSFQLMRHYELGRDNLPTPAQETLHHDIAGTDWRAQLTKQLVDAGTFVVKSGAAMNNLTSLVAHSRWGAYLRSVQVQIATVHPARSPTATPTRPSRRRHGRAARRPTPPGTGTENDTVAELYGPREAADIVIRPLLTAPTDHAAGTKARVVPPRSARHVRPRRNPHGRWILHDGAHRPRGEGPPVLLGRRVRMAPALPRRDALHPPVGRFFDPGDSGGVFSLKLAFVGLLRLLVFIGLSTRPAIILLFFTMTSLIAQGPTDTENSFVRIVLFFIIFADTSQRMSVDQWIAARRGRIVDIGGLRSVRTGLIPMPVRVPLDNMAFPLIGAQIIVLYVMAGRAKLADAKWLDGTTTYYPFHAEYLTPWPELSPPAGGRRSSCS